MNLVYVHHYCDRHREISAVEDLFESMLVTDLLDPEDWLSIRESVECEHDCKISAVAFFVARKLLFHSHSNDCEIFAVRILSRVS